MNKVYEMFYSFPSLGIIDEVGYMVAKNTEELHRKMYPFTVVEIVSVKLYKEEE